VRATVMFEAGDVRIEDVPDARLVEPTDALIRVTRACICGSDLHPYNQMERSETGQPMGHEAVGVVEAVGDEVRTMKAGDVVVMPFAYSDGACTFCREGLQTACTPGSSATQQAPTGRRPRQCVSRTPTGRCSCCPSAKTTRSCRRSSPSRT
jgi:threonine dehydrogenase-like Zn-dependent dehydrogenase